MLDMSKAFDTVKRATLMKDLKYILEEDELHMIYGLINNVKLRVRCQNDTGNIIKTNIGIPQGDCLSPVLFTLYLAQALQNRNTENKTDHNYSKPNINSDELQPDHLKDHLYSIKRDNYFVIDQQYADDIGWATNARHKIDQLEKNIPIKLAERNLKVNAKKTERYHIRKNGTEDWKRCKYLGTILDTKNDIKRRKSLAIAAYNKSQHIFNSKRASTKIKIRTFNAFVSSIFLYNSEIWTLSKQDEQDIDTF